MRRVTLAVGSFVVLATLASLGCASASKPSETAKAASPAPAPMAVAAGGGAKEGAPTKEAALDDAAGFSLPNCPPSLADVPVGIAMVTGTVSLPSGKYALGGAKVSLVNALGAEVATTLSDGCGRFRLDGVVAGKYSLTYGVRSFKGTASVDVPLTGTKIDVKVDISLLKVAVFEGEWDHVETILDKMGVPYEKFKARTVGEKDLSKYHVVFINCGNIQDKDVPQAVQTKLTDYVAGGGALYVSDRSLPYLLKAFPSTIKPNAQEGSQGVRKFNIVDVQLGSYLRGTISMPINYNLGAWRRLEKDQPLATLPLLRDQQTLEPAAVTFLHGKGFVGYTTFHDEAQMNDAMLYSLVFFVSRM